jgi:hypothetical protein
LNDSSRPLNAPRSTTRRHRPGGTSRGSCWSWIPGAPARSSRGGRGRFNPLTPGSAWRSRDAAGTKPKAGGGTTAASAALGRRAAAAAPSTQPHRPAHARRPAPALLTPPSSATASPARPTASQQPSPALTAPKEVPVQAPRKRSAWEQPAGRTAPAGWCCCSDAAARVAPQTNPAGACRSRPGEAATKAGKARRDPTSPAPRSCRSPSAPSTRPLPRIGLHRRSR